MRLNSTIFHTTKLDEVRDFYEGVLELPTGTYVKDNKTVHDYNDSYVNYHLDGSLLCFEYAEGRTDIGAIILSIPDLSIYRKKLEDKGVHIKGNEPYFFKLKDPEGRSITFEASQPR